MDNLNNGTISMGTGIPRYAQEDPPAEQKPPGDGSAPPQPAPPQPSDGFSPRGLAFSIPAYGAAGLQASMVGLREYAKLFTTAPGTPPPAIAPPTAAAIPLEGVASPAGTPPAGAPAGVAASSLGSWMSGFATGILYLKSGHELYQGIREKNEAKIVEGALDFLIGSATLTSGLPGLSTFGAMSTGILLGVKILYDALRDKK